MEKWEKPQFLGNSKIFNFEIKFIKPFISSDKIEGVIIGNTDDDVVMLKSFNELDFEFKDTSIKSTIKKIKTTKQSDAFISINRFTEHIIDKFNNENTSIREQYMLI